MIKLPSYLWFMGLINFRGKGNRYSGSFGCDPEKGNLDGNVFRYSVWIEKDENDIYFLKAVYYVGINAYDSTDKSLITEKTFESSSEGIIEAQEWLQSAADDFYRKKGE